MAKQKTRSTEWGDGYVEPRTLKSGKVIHRARWYEPHPIRGKVLKAKSFNSEDDAWAFLASNGDARREGKYEPESQITLSQAVSDYCEARLELERWTPNTYQTNKIFQQRLIDPQLGKFQVTKLKPMDIQNWADKLAKEKSSSTVSSTLSIVRGTLRRMIQIGVITTNPAAAVEVKPRAQEEKIPWTLEEVQQILAASNRDPLMHNFYLVGFNTGMRPGELRALRWSDIDWETNAVTCARSITKDQHGREFVGKTTKTGKSRVIVAGQSVIDELRKWKSLQNERRLAHLNWHDTIIFDRGDGSFLPGTTLIRKHEKILDSIPLERRGPHTMRHTYATMEDEFGASPGVTKARLGHASEQMKMRYTHAQVKAQKAAAEHMAQLLLGGDSDTTTLEGNGS